MSKLSLKYLMWLVLNKIFRLAGYEVSWAKIALNHKPYELLQPVATYAPWRTDRQFNKVYQLIKNITSVDKYRLYELWQLVAEATKTNGALIEIGVYKGGTGALIAKKAKLMGIKNKVYLCDTFKGIVKAGIHDPAFKNGDFADTSEKKVQNLIDQLGLDNVTILKGSFPEETGKFITEKRFSFCHIDVDVYRSAKDIIKWIWPKMVIGGIIVFDDYGFISSKGITLLVNEDKHKNNRRTVYNLNGHAVIIKTGN